MGYMTDGLTFNTLRQGNTARLPQFKNAKGLPAHAQADGSDWSDAEWLEAVVGELGEYANWHKKFRRGDISKSEFLALAADELADTVTCLDILAFRLGIDLGRAVTEKWNRVSRRIECDLRILPDGVHLAEHD